MNRHTNLLGVLALSIIAGVSLGAQPVDPNRAPDMTILIMDELYRVNHALGMYRSDLNDYRIRQDAMEKTAQMQSVKYDKTAEMVDRLSSTYLNYATYTLTGIVFVVSLFNAIMAFHIGATHREARKAVSVARVEAEKRFNEQLQAFNGKLQGMETNLGRMTGQFIASVDNKRKLIDRLTASVQTRLQKSIGKEDILSIFDEVFLSELSKYDIESFVADLQSDDKGVRLRAVWGVEAMGPHTLGRDQTITILEKVANNTSEDSDIRVQAARSVNNVKGGAVT